MHKVNLGRSGPRVSAIGLGCMGMSGAYGPAERGESVATIRAAIESGLCLIDTGDFYGMGHNEILIQNAIHDLKRDDVIVSVKFGALRDPGGGWTGHDSRPESLKNYLAYSLTRLGLDYIDIYRPSRLDPSVPIEETIGALSDMVQAGYVRHIGLSEVGSQTIRRACAVHPISDLQIEYSLFTRSIEDGILQTCRELGVGITAYGVLSRGLLGGQWQPPAAGSADSRARSPRFAPGNVEHNLLLVDAIRAIADAKGASVAQIAIAWVSAQGEDIVPIIGTRRRDRLAEAIGSLEIRLNDMDLAALEAAVPKGAACGERYPAAMLESLDSEK